MISFDEVSRKYHLELDVHNKTVKSSFAAAALGIKNPGYDPFYYDQILSDLKTPFFDINQTGVEHDGITPLGLAAAHGKPDLVELFLLMGANPFHGRGKNNPLELMNEAISQPGPHHVKKAEREARAKKMSAILLEYQHRLVPDTKNSAEPRQADWEAGQQFVETIFKGSANEVKKILASDVFIYTPFIGRAASLSAFASAVRSRSLAKLKLLVACGEAISEPLVRFFLREHGQEAWAQHMRLLLILEKQKQYHVMSLFCASRGNLDASRPFMMKINELYHALSNSLLANQGLVLDDTWANDIVASAKKEFLKQNTLGATMAGLCSLRSRHGKELHLNDKTKALISRFSPASQVDVLVSSAIHSRDFTPDEQKVLDLIDALAAYGETLKLDGFKTKGAKVEIFTSELRRLFLAYMHADNDIISKEAKDELYAHIRQGRITLAHDRNIQDWLGHLCFALMTAGVGAVVMLAHKLVYGTFFVNHTKRQDLLSQVDEALPEVVSQMSAKFA